VKTHLTGLAWQKSSNLSRELPNTRISINHLMIIIASSVTDFKDHDDGDGVDNNDNGLHFCSLFQDINTTTLNHKRKQTRENIAKTYFNGSQIIN
jgi:hypothetical protein